MANKYFFNKIRVILFFLIFGFVLIALGISFTARGINIIGANSLMIIFGALSIVAAIYLIKKHWY